MNLVGTESSPHRNGSLLCHDTLEPAFTFLGGPPVPPAPSATSPLLSLVRLVHFGKEPTLPSMRINQWERSLCTMDQQRRWETAPRPIWRQKEGANPRAAARIEAPAKVGDAARD